MGGQTIPKYSVVWDEGFKNRRGTLTRLLPAAATNAPELSAQDLASPFGAYLVEWTDSEKNEGRLYLKDDQAATPASLWSWLVSHAYPTESYPANVSGNLGCADYGCLMLSDAEGQ